MVFIVAKSKMWYLLSGSLALAGLVFYLASFKRFDWLSFRAKSGEYLFALLLPQDNEIAEFIIQRITGMKGPTQLLDMTERAP